MSIPRIVIAGISSSCGKTTVATGLMGALAGAGFRVQGFKVGPDFIDPTYHTVVTGRKSRNLDAWMLPSRRILELFHQNTSDCDISVIEGVMGLYDGLSGTEEIGSTANLAKLLTAPVIIVLDVVGMARSAAAVVAGCKVLDKRLNIAGVILNKVAGERHAVMCKEAIETTTGIPVVGAIPKNPEIGLPERHLGLIPTPEKFELAERLKSITKFVKATVNLDKIVEIAKSAPSLPAILFRRPTQKQLVCIGVAYDKAFNFYYEDALDTLKTLGAEVQFFSPLSDEELPENLAGLYIGGGFPEVMADQLEANEGLRSTIKKKAEEGMPILAECGGLMFLTKAITNYEGRSYSMVGVLDCKTQMTRKLTLNYTDAIVIRGNILAKEGNSLRGHEFHFSKLDGVPSDALLAYELRRGLGIDGGKDGWIEYSILAQYMHTHMAAMPKNASRFIKACMNYRRK